ncbi:MAG TPA: tetratricopeptide repeat protein [Candidatus Obscuribacterales bacterium]
MPADSRESHIHTDFFDKQAKESAGSSIFRGPVGFVLVLVAIGVLYGVYKGIEYFVNIERITAMKYVELNMQRPTLKDGAAYVDATVNNWNPIALTSISVRYTVDGASGATVGSGVATISYTVPAGDERSFSGIKLGALSAPAAKMHAEICDVTLGPKPDLAADFQSRFLEIGALKDDEKISALKSFTKDAPKFAPAFITLGAAYEARGNRAAAQEAYEQAVAIDEHDANAHLHLGRILMAKDPAKARTELEKANTVNPQDPAVKEAMSQLAGTRTAAPK